MEAHHDPQLDYLMTNRPSIYGNSFMIWLLKLLAWLLAIGSLVAAGVCYYAARTFSYMQYLEERDAGCNHLQDYADMIDAFMFVVLGFLLLSALLFLVVWLGRMLIRRNQFIMAIEEWYEAQGAAEDTRP